MSRIFALERSDKDTYIQLLGRQIKKPDATPTAHDPDDLFARVARMVKRWNPLWVVRRPPSVAGLLVDAMFGPRRADTPIRGWTPLMRPAGCDLGVRRRRSEDNLGVPPNPEGAWG